MKLYVLALFSLVGCRNTAYNHSNYQQSYVPPAPTVVPTTSSPPPKEVAVKTEVKDPCKDLPVHSQMWEMECAPKEQQPSFNFDDWLSLQKTNKSYKQAVVPSARKTILRQLKSPSTAVFISDEVALQCQDQDTFITVHTVDAQNSFGAKIRDVFCVGVSLKEQSAVLIDCGPVGNVAFNLQHNQLNFLPTNLKLSCDLPAQLLKVK